MADIQRPRYLNRLIKAQWNGSIKVITGIRRCGKSYLLFKLFNDYLVSKKVKKSEILKISLEEQKWNSLLEANSLYNYIIEKTSGGKKYYVFIDEIQFVQGFERVLNSLVKNSNLDIYVTGSNSKFLSSDIITEFRGRGEEIRVFPFVMSEFIQAYNSFEEAWEDYYTYGGLPQILLHPDDETKSEFLKNLLSKVYLSDIVERNNLKNDVELDLLLNVIASGVGSLTNPLKLANTFKSENKSTISDKTVKNYLDFLQNAFLVEKVCRYDVKGKKYISALYKFYFSDVGLRNARLNFRQIEENHLMENIIYNELRSRGFNVDVGVVEKSEKVGGKLSRIQYEVDFVCNKGKDRYYIQSAYDMPTEEKSEQEKKSLKNINDSFQKIIVVQKNIKPRRDEKGILTVGLKQFLLEEEFFN